MTDQPDCPISQPAQASLSVSSGITNQRFDSSDGDSDPGLELNDLIETEEDLMGLFRRYTVLPSTDPDLHITVHHVADAPTFMKELPADALHNPLTGFGPHAAHNMELSTSAKTPYFAPFLNVTVFLLYELVLSDFNKNTC
jgi:hypothetical protein